MHVSLTPELDQYVHDKVASGRYNSASEVVREALRTLQEYDAVKREQLEAVRQKIQAGLDSLERGDAVLADSELMEGIKRRGRERLFKSNG